MMWPANIKFKDLLCTISCNLIAIQKNSIKVNSNPKLDNQSINQMNPQSF
jgi:hypothetical protein